MERIIVYRNPSDGCFSYFVEQGDKIIERMKTGISDYGEFSFNALVGMGRKLPPLKWMMKVDDATWSIKRDSTSCIR